MTDINKQIEEASNRYYTEAFNCFTEEEKVIAKAEFANGAFSILDKFRWRKVSEELPEMGYRVLVRNEFKVSHLGYIDTVGDWRYCLNNELIKDKLLEWKPID